MEQAQELELVVRAGQEEKPEQPKKEPEQELQEKKPGKEQTEEEPEIKL